MVEMKEIIMAAIFTVVAVILVPTVWDAVWVDGGAAGINGSTWTLLRLVPLIFVGSTVIGGILMAMRS